MSETFDIDIDLQTTFDPLEVFPAAVRASMNQDGILKKHPCGAYLQQMPQDPVTGLAAIPYDKADTYDYTKIDFLHLSILDYFDSKQDIRKLLQVEPSWNLLVDDNVIKKLFHLNKWPEVLKTVEPKNIEQLGDCLALIRPGKQRLLNHYHAKPDWVKQKLYEYTNDEQYTFKRSHAIAYAHVIVLQLHLINAGIM